jgi:hypothetical protein
MRTGLTMMALALAGALTLNAQAPQQTPAPQPQAQPQTPPQADRQQPATDAARPVSDSARAAAQTLVIAGCLKEEKDVAGLKPNPAERVGVGEDYILTNVKMAASSTVSGIALATRYEVEGISKDDLKKHVNHQVEITGTITPGAASSDDPADFHGTSLKMLSATCPAM